jgi:hypothetical protein
VNLHRRDAAKAQGLAAALGGGATAGTFSTAPGGEMVVLAVPYRARTMRPSCESSSQQFAASVQIQRGMHDMTRLNGKTAVITGGATGIGLAAAKRFIEEGAFVFIFGRRQEALDAALADLGPNARAVKGSVSDEADLDRLYAAVKAERGTLDIVFANAGVGSQLALGKITAEHIDETFDTNVKGTIFTVQKALPLMGKGGPPSL